ncbi:Rpn family recombination-promoting nuclease/putative transposase [Aerosakkonema sp. BLCC-F183]|uniref:Rpn family recombination-promoting nuclease/putative transposase n=1 Tax=Aerosakkonema sp. BLCC-F183 TaxID=3342834 RepID=UPI0035B8EE50
MSYDNACKYLAERFPADFTRWLLGIEATRVRVLKTELDLEPIRADSVSFLRVGDRILHLEFETDPYSNPPIPFRMLDYSVRLKRKYRRDVEQFVIFLQESSNEIAFTTEYRDRTTTHRYNVIRLWEEDPAIFLDNPGLLPLAVLARSDSPQALLEQVAERVDRIENSDRRQGVAACTGILAGLRFDRDLIRSILRADFMRESVIYQDILQEGRQEGKKEEALLLVTRQLEWKFGEITPVLLEKIRSLSIQDLENLGVDLLGFSELADLEAWLG